MDRKEVCQKIRDLNLQDAVKQHYGDNYTRVSTDKLVKLIQAYDKPMQKAPVTKNMPEPVAAPKKAATAEVSSTYEAACLVFLGLLKDNGLLADLLKKL
jgi:hypothetical protein